MRDSHIQRSCYCARVEIIGHIGDYRVKYVVNIRVTWKQVVVIYLHDLMRSLLDLQYHYRSACEAYITYVKIVFNVDTSFKRFLNDHILYLRYDLSIALC